MKYYSIIKRYQVLKQTMTHINLENILNVNKKMKKHINYIIQFT